MVDMQDGPFDDWCELNFVDGIPPELKRDDFRIEEIEQDSTEPSSERFLGTMLTQASVFSHSLIVEYGPFWSRSQQGSNMSLRRS